MSSVARKKVDVAVKIIDQDTARNKAVLDADGADSEGEDAPTIVETEGQRRVREREERLAKKPYLGLGDDGSGWVSVSADKDEDISPPRRGRHDSDVEQEDISPPRRRRHDSDDDGDGDLSPVRRQRHDSEDEADLSPPRSRATHDHLSPPRRGKRERPEDDLSPTRRGKQPARGDLSPPRRGRAQSVEDLSPPRRGAQRPKEDLSPPRRGKQAAHEDLSPPRRRRGAEDLSPPRRKGTHFEAVKL
eukprot:9262779-Pyramimonas_sp.AAC.1